MAPSSCASWCDEPKSSQKTESDRTGASNLRRFCVGPNANRAAIQCRAFERDGLIVVCSERVCDAAGRWDDYGPIWGKIRCGRDIDFACDYPGSEPLAPPASREPWQGNIESAGTAKSDRESALYLSSKRVSASPSIRACVPISDVRFNPGGLKDVDYGEKITAHSILEPGWPIAHKAAPQTT